LTLHRIGLALVGERGRVDDVVEIVVYIVDTFVKILNEKLDLDGIPIGHHAIIMVIFFVIVATGRQQHCSGSECRKKEFMFHVFSYFVKK
jgi:hypothetical protein